MTTGNESMDFKMKRGSRSKVHSSSSMKMSATRSNVLRLYKTMLRESQLFNNYNFRSYAIRRIRDAFKANKNLSDCDAIEAAYNEAFSTLAIIKRQVVISDLYKCDKLVIEKLRQSVQNKL